MMIYFIFSGLYPLWQSLQLALLLLPDDFNVFKSILKKKSREWKLLFFRCFFLYLFLGIVLNYHYKHNTRTQHNTIYIHITQKRKKKYIALPFFFFCFSFFFSLLLVSFLLLILPPILLLLDHIQHKINTPRKNYFILITIIACNNNKHQTIL